MSVTFELPVKLKRQADAYSNGTQMNSIAAPDMASYYFSLIFETHKNPDKTEGLSTRIMVYRGNGNWPSFSTSGVKILFTLYDHVGYIIGISSIVSNAHSWTWLYRSEVSLATVPTDGSGTRLMLKDILRHLPPDSVEDTVIVQMKMWTEDANIRAIQHISGQPLIPNAKPAIERCDVKPVTFVVGGKEVNVSPPMVSSLMRESEFFQTLLTKYQKDSAAAATKMEDVEAAVFERFVELVHHKRCVYLRSGVQGATLAECCREVLVLANKWMCRELAATCAECIVHVTSKDKLFSDVYLLEAHYNGDNKLDIIAQMATKIKEMKPEGKEENLKRISEKFNQVSYAFMAKLTE